MEPSKSLSESFGQISLSQNPLENIPVFQNPLENIPVLKLPFTPTPAITVNWKPLSMTEYESHSRNFNIPVPVEASKDSQASAEQFLMSDSHSSSAEPPEYNCLAWSVARTDIVLNAKQPLAYGMRDQRKFENWLEAYDAKTAKDESEAAKTAGLLAPYVTKYKQASDKFAETKKLVDQSNADLDKPYNRSDPKEQQARDVALSKSATLLAQLDVDLRASISAREALARERKGLSDANTARQANSPTVSPAPIIMDPQQRQQYYVTTDFQPKAGDGTTAAWEEMVSIYQKHGYTTCNQEDANACIDWWGVQSGQYRILHHATRLIDNPELLPKGIEKAWSSKLGGNKLMIHPRMAICGPVYRGYLLSWKADPERLRRQ